MTFLSPYKRLEYISLKVDGDVPDREYPEDAPEFELTEPGEFPKPLKRLPIPDPIAPPTGPPIAVPAAVKPAFSNAPKGLVFGVV